MSDFEKHITYFSAIYSLYQSAPSASKPNILTSLINYGHFPAFIYYLNQIWFQANVTPKIATENMEFLITYFQQVNNAHVDVDFGKLSEFTRFIIRIIYQKPSPKSFKDYGEFLIFVFEKIKVLDMNSIFDVLIKCPLDYALFPLSVFGVVNLDFNSKVIKLLFSLIETAFQKEESKNIWIESFIMLLSHKIKGYEHNSAKIISQIGVLLSDSTITTDIKLRILYSSTKLYN